MNTMHRWFGVGLVLLGITGVSVAQSAGETLFVQSRAQTPVIEEAPFFKSSPPPVTPLPEGVRQSTPTGQPCDVSDGWAYPRQGGMFGADGPVNTEVYVRSGPSFVVGGGQLRSAMNTGWEVMGGGRSLFFDATGRTAWAIDLGLSYTINNGSHGDIFTINNQSFFVRSLHRTGVSGSLGYDWFRDGPGFVSGYRHGNLNYGVDVGGRWGTAHVDLNPANNVTGFARRQDNYGAVFAGAHLNMEIPFDGWTFFVGLRGEWSITFMDVLPSSTLQDVNVLLTAGVRF